MKTFNTRFVFGFVVTVSMFLAFNTSQTRAACNINSSQEFYNNGETVKITAVNDSGSDWGVCVYSGGKVNGGTNLPIGSSLFGPDITKTVSAVVNTGTDYSGWKAVVVSGNGCNNVYNSNTAICEVPLNTAGTPAPAVPTPSPTPPAPTPTFPSTNLTNPLSSDDFTTLITNFLQWLLGIAGGLALLMIIYGGVLYITSIGDQQKMETGKKVVTWTLFGLIIILASWSIIKVIDDIFVN
ncbi:MAG: pilin [Patescibacteria group bacterium]